MIKKIQVKDNLSIKEVTLEPSGALNVFSGVSGAGKSIFFESLLALFGLKETQGALLEAEVLATLNLDEYGIEPDDEMLVFKAIKKEKLRYFINNQSISKKQLKEAASQIIRHISLKEYGEFDTENLLLLLDRIAALSNKEHEELVSVYKTLFKSLKEHMVKLERIEQEERKVEELREFAMYEIQKIDEISPKIGEYEELIEQKKSLSKKERIESALSNANRIFEGEKSAKEALSLLEVDDSFLESALNELRGIFDVAIQKLEELEFLDIEKLLDRLEKLSLLKKKYGSIEEALEYKERKKAELAHYDNISFEKDELQKEVARLQEETKKLSAKIAANRMGAKPAFDEKLNKYLSMLLLKNGSLKLSQTEPGKSGTQSAEITLKETRLSEISSGEFNRLRLALLALKLEFFDERGILILDEIDANLSGEESHGVALLLKELSSNYQIFAISHQPHLPSVADAHFLVKKTDENTTISRLFDEERIHEIARTISGKEITKEALEFARKLIL